MLNSVLKVAANSILHLAGQETYFTQAGKMYVPRSEISPHIRLRLLSHYYARKDFQLLQAHVTPEDTVLELGGGTGFLGNAYARLSPHKQHVLIEASPRLCQNVLPQNTRKLKNLTVINAVASKEEGPLPFYAYKDFWASSLIPLHHTYPNMELIEEYQVPTIDLDQLNEEKKFTLLLCNIEGGEGQLFEDFRLDIPKIMLELHWDFIEWEKCTAIINLLRKRGYHLQGSPQRILAIHESVAKP